MILTHAVVTLAAVLFAEGVALGAVALIRHQPVFTRPAWGLHLALVISGAALTGLLLGTWASRSFAHRLRCALEISRAWLRGNLSLRIADPTTDDLGLLAGQLDLLAEHLEQDEQDLDELREHNTRLTDQVRALAVVEERNRLARELHDSVKQHLFSLAMAASGIRARLDSLPDVPDDMAEMMREVETTAQAAQREMTRLIEDLRPGSLQEQGLAAALNDYTLLFGAREHILIYLEVQGNDALLPLSVAEPLYRVAQEALYNVARHARATRADVNLRCMPAQAILTIRDNGVGFDTGQTRRGLGLGLTSMQERLIAVGGRLAVESQIGKGTTVLAEVELPYPLSPSFGTQAEVAGLDKGRPSPTIENWAWLGQRLVIPVGQTWPWLPADQVHLRRPLVEPGEEALTIRKGTGFLGLRKDYTLHVPHISERRQRHAPLVRVNRGRSGYEWEAGDVSWALRHIRGLSGRMVLTRNGQPLAAVQYQGRLLNTWSEIIYDGRGYRLSRVKGHPSNCVLVDEVGNEYLFIKGNGATRVELRRALPQPLLVMVAMRFVDEVASASN
ncbi:MAG: sensor histidine kinase [Chloroflexota bacterium]|nr:sensor histidine kinase [Chloroflexota bacterium]